MKPVLVGSQGIGQDESVTPIVLGARERVSVSEAVDLLWIDGKDGNATLEQGLDDGAVRLFD